MKQQKSSVSDSVLYRVQWWVGLDENHEFMEFTEAVNFGACREF